MNQPKNYKKDGHGKQQNGLNVDIILTQTMDQET